MSSTEPAASIPEGAKQILIAPHPRQWELLQLIRDPKNREVWARAGRRFGKTYIVALAVVEFCTQNPLSPSPSWEGTKRPPTEVAIIGPLYAHARRIFDEICETFRDAVDKYRESDLRIFLKGGARITCYSGDRIDAIRGGGFDKIVADECAGLSEEGIRSAVMPALADRNGQFIAIGTPKYGMQNFFNRRCLEAEQGTFPSVVGFHGKTSDNPRIPREWLDLEKMRTDPITFSEEYLAVPVETNEQWLDPSRIKYIAANEVPQNALRTIICDFAWGKPEIVDKETMRRKDANVISVQAQDVLGRQYVEDGLWQKMLEPDAAFDLIATYIKKYDARILVVEKTGDDLFGRVWRKYLDTHPQIPIVRMVRPVRRKDWLINGVRQWAGEYLGGSNESVHAGKFYMVSGCKLAEPLVEEMAAYNEAASKANRVHDDVLACVSDIMLPGVWQSRRDTIDVATGGVDVFRLKEYRDQQRAGGDNSEYRRITKYSPI